MNVILLASVVLMTAFVVNGNSVKGSRDLNDLRRYKRAGPSNYEPVGCYSSGKLKKAKVFGKKSFKKIKAGAERPIDQCSEGQDYAIIGIQRIKKDISCLNGNEEKWDPNDFKMDQESKCPGGAGSKKTIFIYKKSVNPGIVADGKCRYGDKVFNDGEEAPIYHKTGDVFNDYCELCECIKGNLTDCMHIKCDTGLMGCKEIVYPSESGECCPKCKSEPLRRKCDGRRSWLSYEDDVCLFCECHGQVSATCRVVKPACQAVSCKDPVIPVGECCPYCEPQTTPPPVFTIKPTEDRPEPPFPFPF